MKNYTTILLDLDGTLTDPGIGITNSVMHALEKFNIKVSDRTQLYSFIGPPLKNSFMERFGFTEEMAVEAISYYREYFQNKGIFENVMYEGIPQVLASLTEAGFSLVMATSKPIDFSVKILHHFDLYRYFDFCAGATMDEKRTRKEDVIAYALENIPEKDKSKIIMVGDRLHDIHGAQLNGLKSVGVTYGYGSSDELTAAGADYIVASVKELAELFIAIE